MSVDIHIHNMWGIFCVPVLGEFSHFVNVTAGMKMPSNRHNDAFKHTVQTV